MVPPKILIILIRGRGRGITLSSISLPISLFSIQFLTCFYKSDQGANSMFTHFFYMYAALKSKKSRIIFQRLSFKFFFISLAMQSPCKLLIFNHILKPDELKGTFFEEEILRFFHTFK